jgi:ribosome-binding ATPase YchF (GTP1/OBG family)
MKIGIVGYQGSGKSTLFEWLTGVAADPALAHVSQSASTPVPDERVEPLCKIYSPKKITLASLELVDTPGLSRTHEGNATKLAHIKEAGCLILVVAAFGGADAAADMQRFDEDFLLADMEVVSRRIEKLKEQVKKPKPNRDQDLAELAALEPLLASLEAGKTVHESGLNQEQIKATRSFQLLTEKPRMVVVNMADDDSDPSRFDNLSTDKVRVVGVPIGLQRELSRMSAEERAEFEAEMNLVGTDRDSLLKIIMDVSGQMIYFTAGDKEVRTWMLRQGGTALEAADNIHSDLARGFIRAETMTCADLIRLGSEREIKANNLMRSEAKDYVVRDGDILHIRFSV